MELMTAKEAKAASKKNQDALALKDNDESMKWIIEKVNDAIERGAKRFTILGHSPNEHCFPCFQEGSKVVVGENEIKELMNKKYTIHSNPIGPSHEKGLYPVRITITWE
jgi:hypothetical protein